MDGWIYATGIAGLALIYVVTHVLLAWIGNMCGMKMKIACSALIYRKV